MKRLKWKLDFICLEIVLILMQDRCMICKVYHMLDDVCHMESRFGVLRESISFGARYVHGLRLMHQSLRNHFGSTCWYSYVKRLKWRLGSVCLEIVLILMQDRCTICMEHTICSEIYLDAPDGTPT